MYRIILFFCFLSGFTTLIYEIIWVRLLTLVFGHTTFAVTTVLAAFMAGLALGSFCFGYLADRYQRNPLRLYTILETGIGLFGLFSLFLIPAVQKIVIKVGLLSLTSIFLVPIEFLIFFTILLIPTFLMGGTFPVLSRWIVRDISQTSKQVGRLYGINTLGSVLGAFLAGFFLPSIIGVKETVIFAMLINFGIAGYIVLIPSGKKVITPSPSPHLYPLPQWERGGERARERIKVFVLIAFFASGFAALIYEVAWTRTLCLILGSSTYAFSLMLVTFLLGLSLGSMLVSWISKKIRITLFGFVIIEFLIGFFVLLFLPALPVLPYIFTRLFRFTSSSFFNAQITNFLFCFLIMFIPTLLMGATLPWISHIFVNKKCYIGSILGKIYGINTLGAVFGSITTGFFLLPNLQIESTIKVGIIINFIACAIVFFVLPIRKKIYKFAFLTFLLVFFLITGFLPIWDKHIMSSGVFLYSSIYQKVPSFRSFINILKTDKLLYYRDGISSTVTVHQEKRTGNRYIRTNGITEASSMDDMYTQLLLGYLPSLLHSHPETAMVIGLGTGCTLGAVAQLNTIKEIDVIEIEPAMLEAAKFFNRENHFVMKDPRIKVIFSDARNYLYYTKKKYDLIISEPTDVWISCVANLYTKESFLQVKKNLNEGGIFCQWFHSYRTSPEDFRMIVATFYSVFPHTLLFRSGLDDFLLIGTNEKMLVDYAQIGKVINKNNTLLNDLTRCGIEHPFLLLGYNFFLDEKAIEEYTKKARINSNNYPILEFSAPKNLYKRNSIRIIYRNLFYYKTMVFPPGLINFKIKNQEKMKLYCRLGRILAENELYTESLRVLNKSLAINPNYPDAIFNMGRLYFITKFLSKAEDEFHRVIQLKPDFADAYFCLGDIYFNQDKYSDAVKYYQRGLNFSKDNILVFLNLGNAYIGLKQYNKANNIFLKALSQEIPSRSIRKLIYQGIEITQRCMNKS